MQNVLKLAAALLLFICTQAHACDKAAAGETLLMMQEFSTAKVAGDGLEVRWSKKMDGQSKVSLLKMTTTYANMDACLTGGARHISFYNRKGRLVGTASPTVGIRLVD